MLYHRISDLNVFGSMLVLDVRSDVTNSLYSFKRNAVTNQEAIQFAQQNYAGVTGHLWVPNSPMEVKPVLDLQPGFHATQSVWFAASDVKKEGTWIITADPYPYQGTDMSELIQWGVGEPNGNIGENCVAIQSTTYRAHDYSCANFVRHFYIIEFECPFGKRFNDQGTACIGECAE